MKKQDWIEYFEAVNGRTPSQEELAAALAQGDYQVSEEHQDPAEPLDQEVQENPSPEALKQAAAQQPLVEPQQAAAHVAPAAQAAAVNPAGPQATGQMASQVSTQTMAQTQVAQAVSAPPKEPSAFALFLKGFYKWILSALAKPSSRVEDENKWFPLLNLLLITILATYSASGVVASGVNFGISFAARYNPFSEENTLSILLATIKIHFIAFFIFIFALAFFFLGVIVSNFISRRLINREDNYSFGQSVSYHSRLWTPLLPVFLLTSLLVTLRAVPIVIFLLALALAYGVLSILFGLVATSQENKLDNFYKYLFSFVLTAIILALILAIDGLFIVSFFTSFFN